MFLIWLIRFIRRIRVIWEKEGAGALDWIWLGFGGDLSGDLGGMRRGWEIFGGNVVRSTKFF